MNEKAIQKIEVKQLLEKDGALNFVGEGNVEVHLTMGILRSLVTKPADAPNPTEAQLLMFAYTCASQGLNPYLEECWLTWLGRNKGWTPLVAAQSRVRKAQSQPDYNGYGWGWITDDGTRHKAGTESKVADPTQIIGVWGCVYRKNQKEPFYHEIFRAEYEKKTQGGFGSWDTRPITMLLKVIRDQTHKFAYADRMGNLMTENEAHFTGGNGVVSDGEAKSAVLLTGETKEPEAPAEEPAPEEKTAPEIPKEITTPKLAWVCNNCNQNFMMPGSDGKDDICPTCYSSDIEKVKDD